MSRRSTLLAMLAGFGLVLLTATSVFGYVTQVPTTITVTPSSGTFDCGEFHLVRATVLDQDGKPIKGATVTWSFTSSPSSQDVISPLTSETNKHGVARTWVKFACVAGDRIVTAKTGGISGSAVIAEQAHDRDDDDGDSHPGDGHHGDGHVDGANQPLAHGAALGITAQSLPNTSTLPTAASNDGLLIPAIPALVALIVALAIIVRRFAFVRR